MGRLAVPLDQNDAPVETQLEIHDIARLDSKPVPDSLGNGHLAFARNDIHIRSR